MTPDQQRILDAAVELLAALDAVPPTTADYRVEGARLNAKLLIANVTPVVTEQVKAARECLPR